MIENVRAARRAYSEGGLGELGLRAAHFYLGPPEWIGLLGLREGDTVIDVGGFRGDFTRLAARKVGPSGRVLTVEPAPENAAELRENCGDLANVEIVPGAVTDSSGEEELKVRSDSPAAHRMRREHDRERDASASSRGEWEFVSVETYTLDDLCTTYGVDSPEFIKIDIEGGEIAALRGGEQTLEATDRIMVEAYHGHPDPDSPDQVCAPDVYRLLHGHRFRTAVTEDYMVFGWRADEDRAPLLRRALFAIFSGRYGIETAE